MKLNFSMNLPPHVKAKDIELSRQLAERYDSYFVLGDENHPHITVYAVEFPEDAVQQVLDAAEQVIANSESLFCAIARVETHQGYIGVEVIRSDAIMHFHEQIVTALAPLRTQQHSGGKDYGMNLTPEQIANMERYGYPDTMQLYNPHFTITRLKSEQQAEKAVTEIHWDIPEFTVRSFGIYYERSRYLQEPDQGVLGQLT